MEEEKRKRQIRNINSVLPAELIEKIFSKLEFLNFVRCRFVCKAWKNLVLNCKSDPPISISNLCFAHMSPFNNLHFVDFDPKHLEGMSIVASLSFPTDFCSKFFSIENSCCGLLCIVKRNKTFKKRKPGRHFGPPDVYIFNPITNEYMKLPPIPKAGWGIGYFYGLGFSPKSKQFKIARHSFRNDQASSLVEIFSFGTNKWTTVDSVPASFEQHVDFKGGLYWVGSHLRLDRTNVIYRLDIEDEKLHQLSFPPQDYAEFCFLQVFNGTLYLSLSLVEDEYHVWKMDQDQHHSSSSWVRAFVVSTNLHHLNHRNPPSKSYYLQLIKACEDGKILCLYAGLDLLLYDPKSQTTQILTDQHVKLKKRVYVHQFDSFNFNSLHQILAGNG